MCKQYKYTTQALHYALLNRYNGHQPLLINLADRSVNVLDLGARTNLNLAGTLLNIAKALIIRNIQASIVSCRYNQHRRSRSRWVLCILVKIQQYQVLLRDVPLLTLKRASRLRPFASFILSGDGAPKRFKPIVILRDGDWRSRKYRQQSSAVYHTFTLLGCRLLRRILLQRICFEEFCLMISPPCTQNAQSSCLRAPHPLPPIKFACKCGL